MADPLVSVIVAVHDGEAFLRDALESLERQTYEPVEIVVVDDGSTDATGDIARSFAAVRYKRQANAGAAAARNTGLALAAGEYVAFLDADDVAPPSKLSAQVGYLLAHRQVDCVLGRQELFFHGPEPAAWADCEAIFGDVGLLSAVAKTALLRELGGFDESYGKSEDRDLFVRMREHGTNIAVIPDVVLRRRVHEGNLTLQPTSSHAIFRSLKARIDRGREAARTVEDE